VSTNQLRPEANPLDWQFLTISQQRAVRQLGEQLSDAIVDLDVHSRRDDCRQGSHDPSVLTWLRSDSLSRISLLQGERGSGKTTVLLSLLQNLEEAAADSRQLPPDLAATFREMDRRLVFLEPIDLNVFPNSANLFAAILARIERRIVQKLRNAPGLDDAEAQRRLGEMYRKVAVAWGEGEDGKADRSKNLDSEAAVVKRIERERLELRETFGELLNLLAERVFHGGAHRNPIFVLPIDDFDLNPRRCFSLLNLLRQVSVPRLYTIVIGNFRLASAMVHIRYTGEFAEAAGKNLHAPWLALGDKFIKELCEETAEAWLRKSLPPQQRVVIDALQPREVLNFRPVQYGRQGEQSLEELLNVLPVIVRRPDFEQPSERSSASNAISDERPSVTIFGQQIQSFLDFITYPGIDVYGAKRSRAKSSVIRQPYSSTANDPLDSAYWAPSKIRAVPRNVADIWLRAFHAGRHDINEKESSVQWEKHWNDLLKLARDLCIEEVSLDRALNIDEQEIIKRAADRCVEQRTDIGDVPLEFKSDVDSPHTIRTSDIVAVTTATRDSEDVRTQDRIGSRRPPRKRAGLSPGESSDVQRDGDERITCRRNVIVSRTMGWRVYPRPKPSSDDKNIASEKACNAETCAQFMIFHDLLTLSNRRFSGVSPQQPISHRWAFTEWSAGPYMRMKLVWPAPLLNSFWEYDIFLNAWNQVIDRVTSPNIDCDESAEALMHEWIRLSAAMMSWRPEFLAGETGSTVMATTEGWQELLTRLDELAAEATGRSMLGERLSQWLVRISLLFMPELLGAGFTKSRRRRAGLKDVPLTELSVGPKLAAFWTESFALIKRQRVTNLKALHAVGMHEVVGALIDESQSLRSRKTTGSIRIADIVRRTCPTLRQVAAAAQDEE
jgi:hypothetical protein